MPGWSTGRRGRPARIAYVEVYGDEQQGTAAAFVARAIAWFAEHGVTVERVLTDNGSCYRSRLWARPANS